MATQPWFVLVAGINGAGKSTFTQNEHFLLALIKDANVAKVDVINPDTVTRQIVGSNPEIDLSEANKQAADQCEAEVRQRIESRKGSFVIETVLASEKYKAIVDRALKLGWNFLLIYVAISSVEESIKRVAHRVRNGGHDVDSDRIRRRWAVTHQNLVWFWPKAKAALLFFNPPEFATPSLIAKKQGGQLRLKLCPDCPTTVAAVLDATRADCANGKPRRSPTKSKLRRGPRR